MTGLRELGLRNTQIGDEGLDHLKGLAELQEVDLRHTRVGDAGLARLRGLSNLRFLIICNTRITDAAVLKLERTHLMLRIIRDEDMAVLFGNPRAIRYLGYVRSRPLRVACRLLAERAKILAAKGNRAEFIATVDALCGLDAHDVMGLLKLADACADCLRAFEKLSPDPCDRAREICRRCAERGVRALDRAAQLDFKDEEHVQAERSGLGRHPGLQLPHILKELQAHASAR
jgi:hypothetical protein